MGFLTNKAVNYLNLHNGTVELMTQVVFIFGSIFLYQHGFSIAQIFFVLGFVALGRIVTRFLAMPLIKWFGLKKTIMIGLSGYGLAVSMLSQVQGIDGWFAAYLILYILFNPTYWVCFHIYYTLMSEERHRGKQYAVRSAIILSGQALFPIAGAMIIKWFGYPSYFALAIPITLTALCFLSFCPDTKLPQHSWDMERGRLASVGTVTSIFRSFYELAYNTLWVFVVFFFLGNQLLPLSGIITFGIFVQIFWQLFIGHHFDKGMVHRIANIGGSLTIVNILGRVFATLCLPVILGLEIINSVARLHINSAIDIATYNDSHPASHVGWYWVYTEITRDLGTLLGTWTVAALLHYGIGMRETMLIALPALLALWGVFIRRVLR